MGEILSSGIQPRGERGADSQWEKYPSRPDLVYLTTAYPLYFGLNALAGDMLDDEQAERVLIVEVAADELPEKSFLPDEDFVAQVLAHQRGCPLEDIHDDIRDSLEEYRHLAINSANLMGNVAFRGTVLPKAITRYVLFDPTKQASLGWAGLDPVISPLNFRFCGGKYQSMVAYLFGDREDWLVGFGDNESWAQWQEQIKPGSYREIMEGFKNREGITVINVRNNQ